MFKYLFILLLSFNISFSNENVVKTSELELFLFKVGFESLLKDVDITKDKSVLNENEIKSINEKIELIMSELYKDKRVLLNDTSFSLEQNQVSIEEFENMKKEISFLRMELSKIKDEKNKVISKYKKNKPINIKKIEVLKKDKKYEVIAKDKKEKIKKSNSKKMRVATAFLAVYVTPNTEAEVVRKIKHNSIIEIEKCKDGWCKLKSENFFVRRFLIKEHE